MVPQGSVRGSDQPGRDEIMMARGEGKVGRGGRRGEMRGRKRREEEGGPGGKDFDGFGQRCIHHLSDDQEES